MDKIEQTGHLAVLVVCVLALVAIAAGACFEVLAWLPGAPK